MTQGQKDGKNPKFRILCKSCNSYLHTKADTDNHHPMLIRCTKCGNEARSFEEEQ
jgi:DNA-directed RNA polymerase subunit M/transcription elongation factor TFIIS